MDEVKKHWRDKVTQVLTWGTSVLIVIAGWSINHSEQFEIGLLASGSTDSGHVFRGVGLIVFVSVFLLAWNRSVAWIYREHLSKDVDATVIPWKVVRRYMHGVSLMLALVAGLIAFG